MKVSLFNLLFAGTAFGFSAAASDANSFQADTRATLPAGEAGEHASSSRYGAKFAESESGRYESPTGESQSRSASYGAQYVNSVSTPNSPGRVHEDASGDVRASAENVGTENQAISTDDRMDRIALGSSSWQQATVTALADLDRNNTLESIENAAYADRMQTTEDVQQGIEEGRSTMATLRSRAAELDANVQAAFAVAEQNVAVFERELDASIHAAQQATEETWDAAKARIVSVYRSYLEAIRQAGAIVQNSNSPSESQPRLASSASITRNLIAANDAR